jgi:hypothetical protein
MASTRPSVRRRRTGLACLLAGILATALVIVTSGGNTPRAQALEGAPELTAQTDDSAPAKKITLFGASPSEATGEVWGIAPADGTSEIVRYSKEDGWQLGPALLNAAGEPLAEFELDTPEAFRHASPSPLAGSMTASGSGALLGTVGAGTNSRQVLIVRNPGGAFQQVALPEGEEALHAGESLFSTTTEPVLAAIEEEGNRGGVLVVPASAGGISTAVIHYDGSRWSREPIEPPAGGGSVEALAITASSPTDAWLLGRTGGTGGTVALFRRSGGSEPTWQPVTPKPGGEPGEPLEVFGEQLQEPHPDQAQLLTATASGVWVDGRMREAAAPTTAYFTPEGESAVGAVTGAWCKVPSSSTTASETVRNECAAHPLPEPLPTDFSRSYAWPGTPYGERIITGIKDAQMLRLTGSTFSLLDTLGGELGATDLGAAFASPSDGWLGKALLPIHVTTPSEMLPNKLKPWPVPFRYALTAVAPEPGAAVGAESSEALAVGDRGEVARYHPGEGWFPETLPGPGGKKETPRLRALAWPTTGRAFAVGDSKKGIGEMWLWRGETGLWEQDPAMPPNFRGNLLGIAFDPSGPARGFAVGEQGVLLSYGKSWVQEPEEAIPAAARGASFTSIAFAGSEAIVAWRKLISPGQDRYTGGLIANSGSGWHEDEGAAAVLGTNAVPWAVAGLPDGGAAFSAETPGGSSLVYEREAAGQGWSATAYPGGLTPGSLVLFREGGALRAIGTGVEPDTFAAEEEAKPPPGFPPLLEDPYPLSSTTERGVLRQTATGWSDEEHELNDAREVPTDFAFWDTPKVPDPVNALLVDSSGTQGWAVGGIVDSAHALLDTSDIYRYPANGASPPGLQSDVETTRPGYETIAVGGGAACAAPCASRADTGIGPEVWTQWALKEAAEIHTGAFVYTGPGVTSGELSGPSVITVPWEREEQYFATRLQSPSEQLSVCPTPSPNDREGKGGGSEAFYEDAITRTPCPRSDVLGGNYGFDEGSVRVIVIDTSPVGVGERVLAPDEIDWLQKELESAGGRPSVVIGNADLPREYAEGHPAARQIVATIEAGKPEAYLFDSPEQNVKVSLDGSGGVEAYGSGTLGYVNSLTEELGGGFIGQSGFLLVEVAEASNSKEPIRVKLIPNVEEVAVEAQQGTLLRRSQAASFAGLARRPRSGNRAHNQADELETAPYIPIPDNCLGSACGEGIVPEYTFHSSNTEYGEFVQRNIHSAEPNAVEHDKQGHRISEEAAGGKAGLFCALNATPPSEPVKVTLKVANLSYSLPVTIQGGSVRQPCGTTTVKAKSTATAEPKAVPPGPTSPAPISSAPTHLSIAAPAPLAPASHPTAVPHPLPQFLPQVAPVPFLPAFVPVPLPTPARPTPPSGTSPVTSPVEAAQKEDEEEAAPESVDAAASAYEAHEHDSPPGYLLGLVILAAFAGAALTRTTQSRRRRRVAPATVSADRSQRRWGQGSRRW